MIASLRFIGSVGLAVIIVAPTADGALAISADLARKCEALTAKAFPLRIPGNPAAGSAKGSGKEEQAYYRKCVKNGGTVPASKNENKPASAK